jgi:putative DNA primase/helicase
MSESYQSTAPIPLPPAIPPVEPFDSKMLPDKLRPWVEDIVERLDCPPEFVAIPAIVAAGSVLGRKIGIRAQAHTEWTEVPNLWGMIVGRPGVMKTPAMTEALKPIYRLEAEANAGNKVANDEFSAQSALIKLQRTAKEAAAKRDAKDDKKVDYGEISRLRDPVVPPQKRFVVVDTSYEMLGVILADNPDGVLVVRDEIVSLLKQLDRDENAPARGFYLSAWDGKGSYTFDRILRGHVHIPACCLSMIGSTQPGRIAEYLKAAVSGGGKDDGFAQRFGLLVWPDTNKPWHECDRVPDFQVRRAVDLVFDRLKSKTAMEVRATFDEGDPLPFLRLDTEALDYFRDWRRGLESAVRKTDIHPALESCLGKQRGLIPRLALIFHLIDDGGGPVGLSAIRRAASWAPYLDSHARRAYASVTTGEIAAAKQILEKLESGNLSPSFTAREIRRMGWSGLGRKEDIESALELLVDHQWVSTEKLDTGGRPTQVYTLNMNAFADCAMREAA